MTRSLEIMIDSATLATITMAVAADSPPMKATMRQQVMAAEQRQRQHVEVAAGPVADHDQAGEGDRQHEEVDRHQIEREDPGRRAQLGLARGSRRSSRRTAAAA